MLVLSRKVDERIKIGADIYITVVRIAGDKVRLGVEAPAETPVHREEVALAIESAASREKSLTSDPIDHKLPTD